ncbi:hypothetical protein JHK82_012900 [Glycine max]|nr:hypothetical protein JHK87_012819 [Glycine soja]KAG5154931.1 hypothetical protein JHK82_012900 [Glycine max]
MEVSITYEIADTVELNPDRLRELKAFDDSKAGVKGLVDEGVTKIPTLFHHPRDEFVKASTLGYTKHIIPVVDLSEVVNSGIPVMFPEDFKDGVQRIYKQDNKVKTELYNRDHMRPFVYNSNYDIYSSPTLNWRDTFLCYLILPNLKTCHVKFFYTVIKTWIAIYDMMLITNDRFKSVEHRVLANLIGPRILCIACFFSVGLKSSPKLYGPIKDLLSEDNHPKYRETTVAEYARYCQKNKVENT